MKVTKALLRWYKSFHLNYREHFDRGQSEGYRPWNELKPADAKDSIFPFIEISLEEDITTIVGANESGKSHLLNAINKVISGCGIDQEDKFTQTDLCHYAGIRKINVEAWPNIGLQFSFDNDGEITNVCKAIGQEGLASSVGEEKPLSVTVILTPSTEAAATVFIEPNSAPVLINEDQLNVLRGHMPKVRFIDSEALLPSELALADLIRGYEPAFEFSGIRDRRVVEKAVAQIQALTAPTAQTLPTFAQTLTAIKENINKLRTNVPDDDSLEMLLFRQILQINVVTLKYLYGLPAADRGYVEGQIAKWNEGIDDLLNLAHFWHQDDQFRLVVDYKDGVIYFEIHDKTECIYTFNERSSGLKYFLSYYLQALAMEMSGRNQNSIILMDEPDSALSILAQRNLLAVFESLVRPESSSQTCQLVYTTHSPYLINRNFPRRIKVVKKEDAEEGTQYIEQARARRYEPVRTALGIDSAPSLFLGSDNILLEGSTDQFLITELIRLFATPENVGDYLDLNAIVVVSADGVGNVSNVLEQSRWADEPIPPTAILLDSDAAAVKEVERVIRSEKPSEKLLPREQIGLIGELIKPFGDNKLIVTTEDIVPIAIYSAAIEAYVKKWLPTTLAEHGAKIGAALGQKDFGENGIVESAKVLFRGIQPELDGDFDKMGIFQQVIEAVAKCEKKDKNIVQLRENVTQICTFLRDALSEARATTTKYSATRSIKRLIKDFKRLNKARVPITHVQKLLKRLEREIVPVGSDGQDFLLLIKGYESELDNLRASGQQRLVDKDWEKWSGRIDSLKNNPLRAAQELRAQLVPKATKATPKPTKAAPAKATPSPAKPAAKPPKGPADN